MACRKPQLAKHHGRFGVLIGPYWGPYYPSCPYYSPYYPGYYSPEAIQQSVPPVYVEQPSAPLAIAAARVSATPVNYWYYCTAAKGYYPYVKACPGGWKRVWPQPPDQH